MPASQAPGVQVRIRDESAFASIDTSTNTGYVGFFDWGPVLQPTNVTTENALVRMFGRPTIHNYEHFFTAWNFLQYGNSLVLVRQIKEADAMNAGVGINADGTSVAYSTLKLNDEQEISVVFGANSVFNVLAKYPSSIGNELSVAIANSTDFATAEIVSGLSFVGQFEYGPQEEDEFAIVILRGDEIIEQYICSTVEGKRDLEGNNIFVEEVFGRQSQYVQVYLNPTFDPEVDEIPTTGTARSLDGGNHEYPSDGEIQAGYQLFTNEVDVEVGVLIDGANTATATQNYIANVAQGREDCIAIIGIPKAEVVNVADTETAVSNSIAYRQTLGLNTYFAALYTNWKYQYDRYNDVFRWVPITGDIAGVYAHTDSVAYPWIAPMGLDRGQIRNAEKLAFNPNKVQQGMLYKEQVNPVVFFRGEGRVVWGQKTTLARKSSFDRVTGARLSFVLRKAAIEIGKQFVGEKNNPANRFKVKSLSESIFRDIQGKDGVFAYYIQVDENNNTPDVIDRNEMAVFWFYQPAKDAEFIKFELVPTRTGVNFQQIIGAAPGN